MNYVNAARVDLYSGWNSDCKDSVVSSGAFTEIVSYDPAWITMSVPCGAYTAVITSLGYKRNEMNILVTDGVWIYRPYMEAE